VPQAAERARREAWQLEKTREVKELTIRGLEPEIQRLVAKHKAELREVNQQKQEELRRQREELSAQVPLLCIQLKRKFQWLSTATL
jgi:5-azacytidine-induced protein 1